MNKNIEDKEFENDRYVKELKAYLELCIEDKDIKGYTLKIDRCENYTKNPIITLNIKFKDSNFIQLKGYSNLTNSKVEMSSKMLYGEFTDLNVLINILEKLDWVLFRF